MQIVDAAGHAGDLLGAVGRQKIAEVSVLHAHAGADEQQRHLRRHVARHLAEHVVLGLEEQAIAEPRLRVAERVRLALEVGFPDAALAAEPALADVGARAVYLERQLGGGAHRLVEARWVDARHAQEDEVAYERANEHGGQDPKDAADPATGSDAALASEVQAVALLPHRFAEWCIPHKWALTPFAVLA